MMPSMQGMKRVLIAGAFSAVAIAAPVAVAFGGPTAAPSAVTPVACAGGESNDLYTDNCVPDLSPNVPGGNWSTPAPVIPSYSGQITESTPGDPESLPEVDGVPCTGRDSGACIGLEEDAAPPVIPHSTLSSSP
jgi:hypothetical protein